MKAFLFYAPGDIRFEETARPQAGRGEVVVEIKAALTCGTDLKTYKRGHPLLIKETPSVFGHELAGVIAEIGPGVEGFAVGQRVVAANSAPCGRCFTCRRERPSLCEHLEFLNGAYAEFITVPARIVEKNLLPIPDGVTFRQAALTEPLACAVHGIERSKVKLGDVVCIIGQGPIGLMFTQLAKLKGARVIAVAIEAVGRPETWEQAIAMTRPGGLVNLFGGCKSGTHISVDTRRLHYDELEIIGVFHHTPHYVRAALSLISTGQIDADALISHEMVLEKLEEALHLVDRGEALKVAIVP
jgi:L-iditol 2-dehydrogenase